MSPAGQAALLFLIFMEIAAPVLRILKRRTIATWALVLGTVPVVALAAGAVRHPTQPASNDWKWLAYVLAILALSLLSLLRRAHLVFWLAWAGNLFQIGIGIYLAFFWHVFS